VADPGTPRRSSAERWVQQVPAPDPAARWSCRSRWNWYGFYYHWQVAV